VKIDLTFHPIPRAVIGETGDVDLSDSPDTKLESVALPHAVNMTTLESFAGWLRFCFHTDKETVFLEDSMNRSPGTGEVKLVLDPSGTPRRIFLLEPDYSSFQ